MSTAGKPLLAVARIIVDGFKTFVCALVRALHQYYTKNLVPAAHMYTVYVVHVCILVNACMQYV